jgi:hypothetical protein
VDEYWSEGSQSKFSATDSSLTLFNLRELLPHDLPVVESRRILALDLKYGSSEEDFKMTDVGVDVRHFWCFANRRPGLRLESGRICEMDELVFCLPE